MCLGYFFNCVWLASEFELLLSHGSSFINPSLRRVQCATQLDRLVLYHMCCDVEKSLLPFLNMSSCVMERGYDRSCPEADWLAFAFFNMWDFTCSRSPQADTRWIRHRAIGPTLVFCRVHASVKGHELPVLNSFNLDTGGFALFAASLSHGNPRSMSINLL